MSETEDTEEAILDDMVSLIVDALGLTDAEVDTVEEDGALITTVSGEDLGLFIGRHGQTIDAVQHLAQRAVATFTGEQRRVVVDAEGYRERRREVLQRQADEAADEACRLDRPVPLEAMSASERRLVHEFLRDREDVETHSEGEGGDRRLVVSPAAAP
ncbi:MAG: KH domain-containing protein [Solirubrobacterales bacterium]|nr:KH domain-containing protein [Solirubrobacterales bacterium]